MGKTFELVADTVKDAYKDVTKTKKITSSEQSEAIAEPNEKVSKISESERFNNFLFSNAFS